MNLLRAAEALCRDLDALEFGPPVTNTYNPLVYARAGYQEYLRRFGQGHKRAIFLGMNPGPWGMAQTGVPFGDPQLCREWLGIEVPVERPPREHPSRPVLGFACHRKEVSGTRVWSLARELFGTPEAFFRDYFVANYCPYCFMEQSGRNRTPDKLRLEERQPLFDACDRHLRRLVEELEPRFVIGIGAFAAQRAGRALEGKELVIGQILHPSPASPKANDGWAERIKRQLRELGVCTSC